ncbi:DUF4097 family beta strand repeat-containing protein [Silvibacterium acidisoli]|uniref:DUF4097 family beta strand repeat-containing protein n=1 Tax=Acidobacteriaceae bacterium ZG23-2 TaxID=2883246 RepID=UPI00406C5F93
MRSFQWIALAVMAISPAALLAADGRFEKSLHVSGTTSLNVNTGSGYIHVIPGSGSEVHIIGHVHANGFGFGASAEDRVQQVVSNPPIQQNGDSISVGHNMEVKNVSIDYDITTPKGTNLEAHSGSGDIHISQLGGPLKAGTGSGSIDADGLAGEVSLDTGSGDIRASISEGHDVKAQTGSGSVRLQGVNGGLYARTGSGDIEVAGHPGSDWKLDTGSGSVKLVVGTSAKFTLDASTGSGDIQSDPPISVHGNLGKHHITGEVNGGGPTVRVSTGSGDISVH